LENYKHYDIFFSNNLGLNIFLGVAGTDTTSGYNGEGTGASVPSSVYIDYRRIVITPLVNLSGNGIRIAGIMITR
jgi:hypothetical protein